VDSVVAVWAWVGGVTLIYWGNVVVTIAVVYWFHVAIAIVRP